MNRKERRIQSKDQHENVSKLPEKLTLLPPEEYPPEFGSKRPVSVWRSKRYLVQLYTVENATYPGLVRLSICRSRIGKNGRWEENITWEELQAIKSEVGFSEWYGLEIYPPDSKVVNVSNMHHIWLLPLPLPIGWV